MWSCFWLNKNYVFLSQFCWIGRESRALVLLFIAETEVSAGSLYDTQGPVFVSEPSSKVEFTNSSGGRVDCSAHGNPAPSVEWLGSDNLAVSSIPAIRIVLGNGSIYFPPFEAEVFRQDVHWAVYRCFVSNSVGAILSRDVTVRAGKLIQYFCNGILDTTGFAVWLATARIVRSINRL